ncbi:hypothetical protein [uncultured Muriicola sp.]|uniref:hypothetical protein n=1 Tax=uncultured Muriicola sp. TaxID=1583102 RepID=UPI002633CCC1|nr:hypothetical protein [uncultured Muriicola sp.]
MTTFFTIFFILVLVNAALLSFSIVSSGRKQNDFSKDKSQDSKDKVFPLDLSSSEYRKAI